MTTSFTPGNSLQGTNTQTEPTTLDFYRQNIPRGTNLFYEQFWSSSISAQPATLTIPNGPSFTFVTGVSDVFEFYVDTNNPLITINFDNRTYVSSEIVDLINNGTAGNYIRAHFNTSTQRIDLITLSSGVDSRIRVFTGNSVLGLASETIVNGTDLVEASTPPIQVAPRSVENVELHYWKCARFLISENADFGDNFIQIVTKRQTFFFGQRAHETVLGALLAASDKVVILPDYTPGVKWYNCTISWKVPLMVDAIEKSTYEIRLVNVTSSNNLVIQTSGLISGQVYLNTTGWSIDRTTI